MSSTVIRTKSLRLVGHTVEQLRILFSDANLYQERFGRRLAEGLRGFLISDDVSPDFLAQLAAATTTDLWKHGFAVMPLAEELVIGLSAYKAPPDPEGVVEIAYGIAPSYQNKGYATEAAQALVSYAFDSGLVKTVRAHTLPEVNASGKVLQKCGFAHVGPVTDPEDGLVWRWEKKKEPATAELRRS